MREASIPDRFIPLTWICRITVYRQHCSRQLPRPSAKAAFRTYVPKGGLSAHSIAAYSISARGFIAAMGLPGQASHLDSSAIRRYFLDVSQYHAVATVKLCAAGLRSFLRFCLLQGVIACDLATAVTPVGRWQRKPMPPVLTDEAIERVLATADRSCGRCCRDFAILQQLLACLGLRASEVFALRLEDLHCPRCWENGEILVQCCENPETVLPVNQPAACRYRPSGMDWPWSC